MPSSIKGKGAWVTGGGPVKVGVILDDLFGNEEVNAIERYRKLDDAIINHIKNASMVVLGTPTLSPHINEIIWRVVKGRQRSAEELYRTRVEQLRAWGWFSRGPEDLTEEE